MPGLGTLVNVVAILLGAGLGMALGGRLPHRTRDVVTDALIGASGPIDWDKNGDVTKASIMVYGYNDKGEYAPQDYVVTEAVR